jgi:stage III sporulation protein AH
MKLKNLWKRNAVVAAVVLFVCVAAYLNWSYSRGSTAVSETVDSETVSDGDTRTLGEAVLVSSDGETGESVSYSSDSDSYFASARLSREQARDEALAILQTTVDDTAATEEARNMAAESITAMAACSMAESEIEGLVAAKGYTSCVAYVNDESASVVVGTGDSGLSETDVAIITDIVRDETGLTASQIKVIETDAN